MNSTFTMRQYDEYVQQQRHSYQDAQSDLALLAQGVQQVVTNLRALLRGVAPKAAPQLPAAPCAPGELTSALQAGPAQRLGPC